MNRGGARFNLFRKKRKIIRNFAWDLKKP